MVTPGGPGVWSLRDAAPSDVAFLRQMLHVAIYVHEGEEPVPESVVEEPELRRYVDGFGRRRGDLGVVALEREHPVGACWLRAFSLDAPGYGWIEGGVPELSVAVVEEARGRGLGTTLIEAVLQRAAAQGVARVSLSVDPRSRALHLYERLGFEAAGREGTSVTMVRATTPD